MHSAVHQAIAAVWRIESARIVAVVARMVRDIGVAEELAQDALVSALEHWPRQGVPDNPGAWLTTAAKRRALDHLRHHKMADAQHEHLAQDLVALQAAHRARLRRRARCRPPGRDRRRPAAADLHRLPSAAVGRCARGADAEAAGWPEHARDRARLPGDRADDRAAHRARQAHAQRGACALRGAARRRAGRAPGLGAGGGLPDLQRRLQRHPRRRLDAPGAVRRGAAPGPHAGRTGAAASPRRRACWH